MVNFAENNLTANLSASTLDRKAMLETSSESSEHFRHVYDGPGALLPVISFSFCLFFFFDDLIYF